MEVTVLAIVVLVIFIDHVVLIKKVLELEKRITELPDLIAREKKAGRYV